MAQKMLPSVFGLKIQQFLEVFISYFHQNQLNPCPVLLFTQKYFGAGQTFLGREDQNLSLGERQTSELKSQCRHIHNYLDQPQIFLPVPNLLLAHNGWTSEFSVFLTKSSPTTDEHHLARLHLNSRYLTFKGMKCEWMTVKDEHLYVGGLGKEWTTQGSIDYISTHLVLIVQFLKSRYLV